MTDTMTEHAAATAVATRRRPFGLARHSLVLAKRSLIKSRRNPGILVNGVLTPVIFLLLFVFLFGGSVAGSTGDYLQYLFPGILVMGTVLSGMMATGLNLNIDIKKGVFDRFRSLPIGRSAPLIGSVLADLVRYVVTVVLLFAIGYLIGFRVETDFLATLAAAAVAITLGFCISWVSVFIGVLVKQEAAVQAVAFIGILPLAFGTNLVAAADKLPGWLQGWVEINPVTHAMNATRGLLLHNGGPVAGPVGQTLLWSAIILVIFAPLSVLTFRRND